MFSTTFCIHKMYRRDSTGRHQSAYFQTLPAHRAEHLPHGECLFSQFTKSRYYFFFLFRAFRTMDASKRRQKT